MCVCTCIGYGCFYTGQGFLTSLFLVFFHQLTYLQIQNLYQLRLHTSSLLYLLGDATFPYWETTFASWMTQLLRLERHNLYFLGDPNFASGEIQPLPIERYSPCLLGDATFAYCETQPLPLERHNLCLLRDTAFASWEIQPLPLGRRNLCLL